MSSENYYKLLGVSETATDIEIRKAYVKMIRQFPNETHPEEFQLFTKAYKTLFDEEQRVRYDAQLEMQRSTTRITAKPKPVQPNLEHQSATKNHSEAQINTSPKSKKKKTIFYILLACAVLYIFYTTLSPSKEVAESVHSLDEQYESSEETVGSSTNGDSGLTNEESVTATAEDTTVESSLPSKETVEDFLHQYFLASVEVINGMDFSKVEPFLDPTGKKLDEQRSYTQYLLKKEITEEFVSMFVKDVQSSNEFIIVTVEEVYNIFYSDGSAKKKTFESVYHLRVVGEQLLVNELLSTNELNSEELSSAKLNVNPDHVEQFLNKYMEESVNAVNYQDFSSVESYLSPNSNRYFEQLDYTNYLIEKGITEKLLSFNLVDLKDIGNQTYEATTRESYNIYYSDGSSAFKEFESRFQIIQNDSELKVSQLIYTNEVQ